MAMDRVNISFASLDEPTICISSRRSMGWVRDSFSLGVLRARFVDLLLLRFGARRWLADHADVGCAAAAMMFVRTPVQFYVLRFSGYVGRVPQGDLYLMQWFPPEMRARAVSRFYISLPELGGDGCWRARC